MLPDQLGEYQILGKIGAGGMGEVYRARDLKLNRDVAIKVLPDVFSSDPDRLARFRREAHVLASLNHQNIGQIYGLEDQSGTNALVLELIDGPTLADRIADGALGLDEALPVARQIADALECAHEQGIVHRDLKPANIKLRPDGTVKVLDFGLAKALDPLSAPTAEAMNSPTLTAHGTRLGIIVGTAAYMAPEQARGRAVDRRADIWAFGCVLYEMLSGKRAFEEDDVSTTLASVLKDDVDWAALPAGLPLPVQRVLRRCLEKDPRRRLSAIADARLELEEASVESIAPAADVRGARRSRAVLPWSIAAAATLVALVIVSAWRPWSASLPVSPLRISGEIGAEAVLSVALGPAAVLSHDGETVVFVASNPQNRILLYVRRLSELHATPLAGTEDAHGPFFSPDGRWIAFFAEGSLKKVAVTGGAPVRLCAAPAGRGGWWSEDGTIVFQPSAGPDAVLHRVPEEGGTATPAGRLALEETTQRWPQVLPRGRGVLYTGHETAAGWDGATIRVLPPDGSPPKTVHSGGYFARYVATGHLLYLHQSTLFAVPFDLDRLAVTGPAVPLIEGVLGTGGTGGAQYSVSDSGRLVYLPGSGSLVQGAIQTMDAAGNTTFVREEPLEWYHPRYSSDGTRLAVTVGVANDADIWIHESGRGLTQFTFNPGRDVSPVWTPNDRRIAFGSSMEASLGAAPNIYWQLSDGTGQVQRLTTSRHFQVPSSFHRSGRYLAIVERHPDTNNDVMIVPLEGGEKTGWKPGPPVPFADTPANESAPVFSPDGRWIAYMSTEGGAPAIYVRPFPSGPAKWKISTDTGVHPRWSRARLELFYLVVAPQNPVMVVSYETPGDSFKAGAPRRWSPQAIQPHAQDASYDIHPNGRLIVMNKPPERFSSPTDKVIVVTQLFDELRRVAPPRQ